MPWVGLMSPSVNPTGASLKAKVTSELLSVSLSAVSTISITTVGLSGVDRDRVRGRRLVGVERCVGELGRIDRHRALALEAVVGREHRRIVGSRRP